MHVYSPTDNESALKQFQGDVSFRFSNDNNVVMGRIMMKAGGPHPCSQFEVGELFDSFHFARALEGGFPQVDIAYHQYTMPTDVRGGVQTSPALLLRTWPAGQCSIGLRT